MELTVKLLRTRLQSRLALHKQFASLGECLAPPTLPEDRGVQRQGPFAEES